MSIAQIEQERAAFILYASGTTVHKNINFRNCQTVAVHKPVTTDAKAYGAILVTNVDATYTMENVHAYDCKVFALQKIGTLGARISGTSTLKNNSVNNCYVENYECNISERFTSGKKTISRWTVEVYADFYPHGEVGGMYGFIQGSSTLTNCKVNATTIYAFGQDDKMATIDGSGLAKLGIAALGYYKVPGRHVSTMIGNIRATGTVTLTGCSVDANTKCTNRHDKHNNTYNYIGQAYIVKFVDTYATKGDIKLENKTQVSQNALYVYATNLSLESSVYFNLNYLFANLDGKEGVVITYEFTHHDGVKHIYTTDTTRTDVTGYFETETRVIGGTKFTVVVIDDFTAADLSLSVKCDVTIKGELVSTITTSVSDHCARAINNNAAEADLYMAIMKYSNSAYAYYHGDNN
jgi:hypothetical protein